ncbi:MAG: RecQ family ATP-dependent DNA helicase [Bacteroidales bacterium]|nr:RecQ family ATP-dependent DNA helicase [Bacteroidales bacterium]
MDRFEKILTQYWGFTKFRPLQKEIITEAYEGRDVLGLLPTGGGKSIIFQVAALAREGTCLVITPLIALMKDQVENLKKQGIKATAIYSGMSYDEIKVAFDNCILGGYKFLYISPERLGTRLFHTYLEQMTISLLAVDEAHCISQWGYDFRPSYLKIADIREKLSGVPVLAVTATATPEVVNDIQQKLNFPAENVFQKSFERENLIYIVRHLEDKQGYLIKTIGKVKGTGIVYARSRKRTREIAEFLKKQGVSADYYHAGLKAETRERKQMEWKSGKIRVIVATNAFGMGIDKADVRFVIHHDVPESLEAYFQEAGRGGRDGKKAYAVLLYNETDKLRLKENFKKSFPEKDFIKRVYEAIFNYYQIPAGEGIDQVKEFILSEFVSAFNLPVRETFSALKILMQESYWNLSDGFFSPSKIKFLVNETELYKFQVKKPKLDPFIKLILRSYSGVFTDFVKIDESKLARQGNLPEDEIRKYLHVLHKFFILHYIPESDKPKVTFLEDRLPPKFVGISKANYESQKKRYEKKLKAVLDYANNQTKCRSRQLVAYFGQKDAMRCGECDVCRLRNEVEVSKLEFDMILKDIKALLKTEPIHFIFLVDGIKYPSQKTIKVIQWLLDHNKIIYDEDNRLVWHKD